MPTCPTADGCLTSEASSTRISRSCAGCLKNTSAAIPKGRRPYERISKDKTDEKEDAWGKRLYFQQLKRAQGKYAKKFGQHLFKHEKPREAEELIRELIQQAKERVIIIDPFFATLELFKYVLAIPSPVDVTIVTGNEPMRCDSKYSTTEETIVSTGREILSQIDSFQKKFGGYTIKVDVMTGDNVIHDRFLIIDDQVWFSGNSLNNIGDRASMMIRLPNPQELLDYLDELKEETSKDNKRIVPLKKWLEERKG